MITHIRSTSVRIRSPYPFLAIALLIPTTTLAQHFPFFVKRTPWRVTFTKGSSGEVVGLIADLDGVQRTGRKVSNETPPPAVVAGNAVRDRPQKQ